MNDDISNKMAAHLDTQPFGQPAQPTSRTSKIKEKNTFGETSATTCQVLEIKT
jgi:hypothetical protein